jgi:hypothetical protein
MRGAGLRLGFSRHCSVVTTVPEPSWSIAPPSRTQSACAKGKAASLGDALADVLVAFEVVLVAPAVEPKALRPALLARADDDGPLSRSQMSPNCSTMTFANGASLRAFCAHPHGQRPARPARPCRPHGRRGEGRDFLLGFLKSDSQSSGSDGNPIHTA